MNFIFDPSLVLYLPLPEMDGNSFMSKDAYGHKCTVTGALWTPQGRSFDTTDDHIDCGNSAVLTNLNTFTWLCWYKPTSFPSAQNPIAKRHYKNISVNTDGTIWGHIEGTNGNQSKTTNALTAGQWSFLTVTYNDTGDRKIRLYINGVEVTYSQQLAVTGVLGTDAANNLWIGKYEDTAISSNGIIDEIAVYNRVLNPLEIQHNYLATKERYR